MITSWLNNDTGKASGSPPDFPILVVDVQYAGGLASVGQQVVVYVAVSRG